MLEWSALARKWSYMSICDSARNVGWDITGDAQRYEAERARFEKLNPGYYEEQAAARSRAGGKHVAGNVPQPRAPLNAWRAFVQHKLQEKLNADPGLAAQQDTGLHLQVCFTFGSWTRRLGMLCALDLQQWVQKRLLTSKQALVQT